MDSTLIFTLFGSTGHLAEKKIMPAMYALYRDEKLPKDFFIIAFSRRLWTHLEYRSFIRPAHQKQARSAAHLDSFLDHISYVQGTFQNQHSFADLANEIKILEKKFGKAQKMFYLAIQPEYYEQVLVGLHNNGLMTHKNSRIFVEKPFGESETSARRLEKLFEKKVRPDQLLRVDHYLAKEGFREIVKFRRANKKFEEKLNNKFVDSIEVRMWEKGDIEGRGEFYDKIGALKDAGQNHLLQMLACILMNISEKNENHARAKVLKSLSVVGRPILGQYKGYLQEKDVPTNSKTETYFYFEAKNSLKRWQGVTLRLEAGKAMAKRLADVTVNFKNGTKKVFDIQDAPSGRDAYEVVIEQAIQGKEAFFSSMNETLAAWHVLEPIFKKRAKLELKIYSKGINGPKS